MKARIFSLAMLAFGLAHSPAALAEDTVISDFWSLEDDGSAKYQPSGGICPDALGNFKRVEFKVLSFESQGVQRNDGLCQYSKSGSYGEISAYFYPAYKEPLVQHMSGTVIAPIKNRWPSAVLLEDKTKACHKKLENNAFQVSLFRQMMDLPEDLDADSKSITIRIETNEEGRCAIFDVKNPAIRTFAMLDKVDDWFIKLRISVSEKSDETDQAVIDAAEAFYRAQPSSAVLELMKK